MADRRGEMRASPRNALMGYVADALGGINSYAQRKDPRMPGGLANPVAGLLSNALSVPAIATTADRMSYGAPLTNARQANVPWLKPETADALMMAPVSPRNALAAASMGMGADTGAMRAIFAGITAKTADKTALAQAEKLTAAGADPRKIWKDTGWMKGGDGKWRFEIDDSGAMFNPSGVGASRVENDIQFSPWQESMGPTVGGLIEHPGMKAAYDSSIAPNAFVKNGDPLGGYKGAFNMDNKDITVFAPVKAKDGRSTVLHELQHAVQGKEGFAGGGAPGMGAHAPFVYGGAEVEALKQQQQGLIAQMDAADYLSPKYQALSDQYRAIEKQMEGAAALEGYKRLAGEAEARAVQSRMNLNPQQRRDLFPLDSYDVPINRLIYR